MPYTACLIPANIFFPILIRTYPFSNIFFPILHLKLACKGLSCLTCLVCCWTLFLLHLSSKYQPVGSQISQKISELPLSQYFVLWSVGLHQHAWSYHVVLDYATCQLPPYCQHTTSWLLLELNQVLLVGTWSKNSSNFKFWTTGVSIGLQSSIPTSADKSRIYFLWDKMIPWLDRATSISRKYFIPPKFFISNSLESFSSKTRIFYVSSPVIIMSSI